MRPADDIEQIVRETRAETSGAIDEQILAAAQTALESAAQGQPNIWRLIMKSRITKFAVAAIIIAAVLVGISQFGGSIDGSGTVFADVIEQIYNAKSVTYKQTFETEDLTFTSNYSLMEPGYMRSELPHGDIHIWDFSTGTQLHLMLQLKRAIITQLLIGRNKPTRIHNYFEWLKRLHEEGAEYVGREVVDGVMTDVFINEIPFEKTTVWVDPETNLPVKVIMENYPNTDEKVITPQMSLSTTDFGGGLQTVTDENGQTVTTGGLTRTTTISSSHGSGKGIQDKMIRTYHDFVWDAQLDESLFSLEPPEGYTVKERTTDYSKQLSGADSLIYSLRFWAQMSENTFPDEINDLGDPDKIKPLLIKKFDGDDDQEKELDAAMVEVDKILTGLYFAQEMKVDGSWGYAGKGIELGDADALICWWFDEKTEGYKGIYGDLSIDVLSEDQLPVQP